MLAELVAYDEKQRLKTNKLKVKTNTFHFIKGFIQAINAIQQLLIFLNDEYGFQYLATRRLNQDPLENSFGKIRVLCGHAVNPSCRQFEAAFLNVATCNLDMVTSKFGNCEADNSSNIIKLSSCENVEKDLFSSKLKIVSEIDQPLPFKKTNIHSTYERYVFC